MYNGIIRDAGDFFNSPSDPVSFSVIPNEYSTYQEWGKDVWQKLGEGRTLGDALNYAIQETERYGPESAVQNYRLKGQGLEWMNIRLSRH